MAAHPEACCVMERPALGGPWVGGGRAPVGVLPECRRRGSLTRERERLLWLVGPRRARVTRRGSARAAAPSSMRDMSVCYGCLYDFSRGRPPELGLPELGEAGTGWRGDTVDLSSAALVARLARTRWEWSRTPFADVGERWRGGSHDRALARERPRPSRARGLQAPPSRDSPPRTGWRSATWGNQPGSLSRGEVRGRVIVPYGESVDVRLRAHHDGTPGKKSLTVAWGVWYSNSPAPNGWVAQLVEQGTENPRVRGSTPFPATRTFAGRRPCVSGLLSMGAVCAPQGGTKCPHS